MYFPSIWVCLFFVCSSNCFIKCPAGNDYILPETDKTTEEIIRYHGFPVETHTAISQDGYMLTMQRIPYGRRTNTTGSNSGRPAVFLAHGLGASGAMWVLNLPHQSLAFLLADRGYDVWIANVRGTSRSQNHLSLSCNQSEFWDFSWENIAELDLPAMVDYILNETSLSNLTFVGHSQGCLVGFAKLASDESFNKKINLFFALSPVSTVGDIRHSARFFVPFSRMMMAFASVMGHYSLRDTLQIFKYVEYDNNVDYSVQEFCKKMTWYFSSVQEATSINKTRLSVYMSHIPDDTSIKNFVHFAQLVSSGRFQKYDYGYLKNYFRYGSVYPPEYKIENINVTTVVFWSPVDEFASGKDMENLLNTLKSVVSFEIDNFRHVDFLLSIYANELIYSKMFEILPNFV